VSENPLRRAQSETRERSGYGTKNGTERKEHRVRGEISAWDFVNMRYVNRISRLNPSSR